jgi:dolichyl-diphosphooligosaccharide--protein glycosyltransferase
MKAGKISGSYFSLLMVAAIFCAAFFIRAYFPAERIFGSEWVKFNGTDSYFYMRLVDNLVANFPRLTGFDPFHIFPDGWVLTDFYFFPWLLAAIIWLAGLGSPSPEMVDFIGVYFPAFLGALTVIPVYFLGRELFNRWAGVLAAILVALLPGEFLSRSTLGFADHHVAEVLLSTTGALFLVLALKSARRLGLTFGHFSGWKNLSRPVIFSLFGGLFMGLYFITWPGAPLLVFIIFLLLVTQMMIDHLQKRSAAYPGIVGLVFFAALLLVYLAVSRKDFTFNFVPLLIALVVPPVLAAFSFLMAKWKLKPLYFPLAVFAFGVIIIVVFGAALPGLVSTVQQKLSIFLPTSGIERTTLEMRPFFAPVVADGGFFLTPAWLNLYTALPLSIFGFFILAGVIISRKQFAPERVFFLIWSLLIFLITVQQRRFDYYFTVNAGLLTGYVAVMLYLLILLVINFLRTRDTIFLWGQIQAASGVEVVPENVSAQVVPELKQKKGKQAGSPGKNYLGHILAVLLIFFLVVYPGLGASAGIARAATFVPSDGWYATLTWLRENSPEPLGEPDAYYRFYPADFRYPDTAYGVMSWWDYGYWITRIAHRIPVSNPGQDTEAIERVAGVLLSQDEASARDMIRELKTGYIIADSAMATSKLWAIAQWNGQDISDYYGTYFILEGNQLFQKTFYYPEYYRSLLVRLYNFDGKAVAPAEVKVISYKDGLLRDETGKTLTVPNFVTDNQTFPDYQQAVSFINSHEGNYRIVSDNPFVSAVPLGTLTDYRLVFSSEQMVSKAGTVMPEVKIFQVNP